MTLLMTGNTLPRDQLEDILSLPISVPPRSVQNGIVEEVATIREEAMGIITDAVTLLKVVKGRIETELVGS